MKVADVMSQQFSGRTGWRQKSPNARERLRQLLSDGLPHSNIEMCAVGGFRAGARLEELHRDANRPLHYVRKHDYFDDTRVSYQLADEASCTICKAKQPKGEK